MILKSSASLVDVWSHCLLRDWRPTPSEYQRLVGETLAGRVHAGIDFSGAPTAAGEEPARGRVVAIGGVFRPRAGHPGTCWLSIVPDLGPRKVVVATLLMRAAIRAELDDDGLVCVVRDDTAPGARLARALGFVRSRDVGPFVQMVFQGGAPAAPAARADRRRAADAGEVETWMH